MVRTKLMISKKNYGSTMKKIHRQYIYCNQIHYIQSFFPFDPSLRLYGIIHTNSNKLKI